MKQLRRTIRRIILENQQHYEKLATLICTGEKENVVQAVELAEAVGYISSVTYKEQEWHGGIYHIWKCNGCDPQFLEELEKQYYEEKGNRIVPRFSINFYPDKGLIAISYGEII